MPACSSCDVVVINNKKGLTGAHRCLLGHRPNPLGPKPPGLTFIAPAKEVLPLPYFPQEETWAGRLKSSPKATR